MIALAAVQGAFTLSWVIYIVHLPALLAPTRLTTAFVPTMLLIEAVLAIALEPIMGNLGDRLAKQNRRFQMIWVGVGLSVLLFLLLLLLNQSGLTGFVPGLLIAWAIAISIFRAPAIALLRRYAPTPNLPQAASLITLAAGLAGAARPLATPVIQQLGVPLTFSLAALVLVAATAALSASHPAPESISPHVSAVALPLFPRLGLIALLGMSVTLAFRLAIETLPKILKATLPQVQPPMLVGVVFLAIAITAIPAGRLARRIGNRRTMAIGLVAMLVGLGLMPLIQTVPTAIALAVGFGAAFSLVSNGTLPLALSLMPPNAAGLSVGSFFGGGAIATSLLLGFSSSFAAIPAAIGLGILSIGLAAICVALSHRLPQPELS